MMSYHRPTGSTSETPIQIFVADRNRMGSQLLAESLGRDPRFEITGVGSATEIVSLAASRKADVAVISADSESEAKKVLQVARTLNAHHPQLSIESLIY